MPKRVDVAINIETWEALCRIMWHEGVNLPEAFRRLVGYGEVAYRAVTEAAAEIFFVSRCGCSRQMILLGITPGIA